MKTQGIPTDLTFKRHLLPWGLRALLLGMVLLWSLPATAAVTYQQIKSFGPSPDQLGLYTRAGLIEGNNGVLYGTTTHGGSSNSGTIFKVNKDGTDYAILHSFWSTVGDGQDAGAGLTEGNDGALYGTTAQGGSARQGTIFKLNKDGTSYSILHSFGSIGGDGQNPRASLIEGNDGALYGTTESGGSAGVGTIFKVNKDGTGYAIQHNFSSTTGGGAFPQASLTEGNDGALYGTTYLGGSAGRGTVFKMNKDGTGYAILHSFGIRASGDGRDLLTGLIEGIDGVLYGTTSVGGASNDAGTIFKLNKDGTDYAILHNFGGSVGDGRSPQASLTEGNDGALYGTTAGGGSAGYGTVFKMNKDGTGYTVLRSFSNTGGDGQSPRVSLIEGNDGALYGTTLNGGSGEAGTIFKVNEDGTGYAVLRSFSITGGDGLDPYSSLTEGNDGVLYGTTLAGGSAGRGTVFKMNKDGTGYAILRSFSNTGGDAVNPQVSLTEGNDGALYGTTYQGGSAGRGTVYKLNKDGTGYAVLYSFIGTGSDGRYPRASLTKGSNGALYGTTLTGGQLDLGTIYRISNNLPPTAPSQTFVRTSGLSLEIKKADVLAACSDPEGAAVSLQSLGSSAQGATITQTATHILYTPVNGDNDQFTYTVSDAQGATSTGTILIQVASIVQSITSSGGTLMMNFAGIPGFNYEVQRATSPGGPWSTLVTQAAPANGLFSYTDPSPPSPSAFYRLIQP